MFNENVSNYISITRLTHIVVRYKLFIFSLILDKFVYGNMTDGMNVCALWNHSIMGFNKDLGLICSGSFRKVIVIRKLFSYLVNDNANSSLA